MFGGDEDSSGFGFGFGFGAGDADADAEGPTTWYELMDVLELGQEDEDFEDLVDTEDEDLVDPVLRRRMRRGRNAWAPGVKMKVQRKGLNSNREGFDPKSFLVANFEKAPFHKLKDYHETLLDELENQAKDLRLAVKSNLFKFIRCKDAISDFQQHIQGPDLHSRDLFDAVGGEKFKEEAEEVHAMAHEMFDDIISGTERTEGIRSALGVMRRFHFLFQIPQQMTRAAQLGDLDTFVHDYRKAKLYTVLRKVALFEKVFQEIDSISEMVRTSLMAKLVDVDLYFREKEKAFSHLYALDAANDPIEHYLHSLGQSIENKFNSFLAVFTSQLSVLSGRRPSGRNRSGSVASFRRNTLFSLSSSAPSSGKMLSLEDVGRGSLGSLLSSSGSLPLSHSPACERHAISLLKKMCRLLCFRLPEFGKFSEAFIFGGLIRSCGASKHASKSPAQKKEVVSSVLLEVFSRFSKIVKQVQSRLESAEQKPSQPSLVEGVRIVRSAYKFLLNRRFSPHELDGLQKAQESLAAFAVERMTRAAHRALDPLGRMETWDKANPVLAVLQNAERIIESVFSAAHRVSFRSVACFHQICSFFVEALLQVSDQLHFLLDRSRCKAHMEALRTNSLDLFFVSLIQSCLETIKMRDRLRTILGERFSAFEVPSSLDANLADVQRLVSTLQEQIVSQFVSLQCSGLIKIIREGILFSRMLNPAEMPPDSVEIRSYFFELLIELVHIRGLFQDLPATLGESCLRAVFQNTVAIFYMEIRRFDTLSFVEALQLDMELSLLHRNFQHMFSPETLTLLERAQIYIASCCQENFHRQRASMEGFVSRLLESTEQKVCTELDCFLPSNTNKQ